MKRTMKTTTDGIKMKRSVVCYEHYNKQLTNTQRVFNTYDCTYTAQLGFVRYVYKLEGGK